MGFDGIGNRLREAHGSRLPDQPIGDFEVVLRLFRPDEFPVVGEAL